MSSRTGRSLLTMKERVFLHLLLQQRFAMDSDSPKSVTQDGVAQAVDVGRNNVAKVLAEMAKDGSVDIFSKHVKGLPSVRKVYFLTLKGLEEAKSIKQDIETTVVDVIGLDGERRQDEIGRLGNHLPKRYDLLELVIGISDGTFDCRNFHENKMREERRYVDFTDKKPAVRTFFGRDRELASLIELLDSPSKRMIIINGIPGIGKTTLLAKYAQMVRDRTNVFWYKVHEWANLKALLRPLAEFLSQTGRKNLEWYLNQTEAPQVGEVAHILEADLKDISALLIFDDVHKADPTVLEFLGALLSTLEGLEGVRAVCTARELPSFYSRSMVFSGLVEEMNLDGLDQESSIQMMRSRGLADGDLREIFRVTNGHPLFLELIDDPKLALGKNIRIFIEQEVFSRLGVGERKIMSIAAVFRYPVLMDAFFMMEEEIQAAAGLEKVELEGADYAVSYEIVDSLLSKSIIYESVGRAIGMHDLLREFSLSRMTPRQRRVYHKAAARYYLQDSSAPARVEGLYHSLMAGDVQTAVSVAVGDGRSIINKGYATQFAPLLDHLGRDMGTSKRKDVVDISLLRGEVMYLQGEWDLALDVLRSLLSSPDDLDPRMICEVNRMIGVIHLNRGEFEKAMGYLVTGYDMAVGTKDLATQADILYDIGGIMERRGDYMDAIQRFQGAKEIAQTLGDDLAQGKALYGIGRVHTSLSEHGTAIRFKEEALRLLERRGDTIMMAKVCTSLGKDHYYIGNTKESIEHLERAMELANAVGDINTMGYALNNLTAYQIDMGQLEAAEDLTKRCTVIANKLNDPLLKASAHFYQGLLLANKVGWREAMVEFDESVAIISRMGSPVQSVQWMLEVADVYINNGHFEETERILRKAQEMANGSGDRKLSERVREKMERCAR